MLLCPRRCTRARPASDWLLARSWPRIRLCGRHLKFQPGTSQRSDSLEAAFLNGIAANVNVETALIGFAALQRHGTTFPSSVLEAAREADGVVLSSHVGDILLIEWCGADKRHSVFHSGGFERVASEVFQRNTSI
jgi:hypothetical protein